MKFSDCISDVFYKWNKTHPIKNIQPYLIAFISSNNTDLRKQKSVCFIVVFEGCKKVT